MRRSWCLEDFPGVNWNQKLSTLCSKLGIGIKSACRLRSEAKAEAQSLWHPTRPGNRGYDPADFPGLDWSKSTKSIMQVTGLSRTTVYRLRRRSQNLTTGGN